VGPGAASIFTEDDDERTYKVVINDEDQYSIWPAARDNPPGWRDAGKSGTRAECLAHINESWTDMRPLSLRAGLAERASRS
jgi:MbtH protein